MSPLLKLAFAISLVICRTLVAAGPPCSADRPVALCSPLINPFSVNPYFWESYCEIDLPPNTVVADSYIPYNASTGCPPNQGFPWVATCCAYTIFCIAVDCDGPVTGLIGPGEDSLYPGWHVDIPCAVDTPERVLADVVVSYGNATGRPFDCTNHCNSLGYTYAGLEYGDECYCGTGYAGGVAPAHADPSECNVRCSGGYYWTCGGPWRMQIYKYGPYEGF